MTKPTIIEVWRKIAETPGYDPPEKTPRWLATIGYLYGEPLSDADVTELVAATGRSAGAIRAHAQRTLGRRRFRQFWARIGRRGRKSSMSALLAVYEAIWGGHEKYLLPGERGFVCVVALDIASAHVIGRLIKLYLACLGISCSPGKIGSVNALIIEGYQIGVMMPASTDDAPRGVPIPVLVLDEFAHKNTSDEYANSDSGLMQAAEPAQAQFPERLVVGISTGMGRDGVHYERVERGLGNDNEEEILSVAGSSWDWSPSFTREDAERIADGDQDVMLREFEGGVSENQALWMPQADALRMFEPRKEYYLAGTPFVVIDAAESADTFAMCVMRWCEPDPTLRYERLEAPASAGFHPGTYIGDKKDADGYPIRIPIATRKLLWITDVSGWTGDQVRQMGMANVVAEIAERARRRGARQIIGDDRAGPYLEGLFSTQRDVQFSFVNYTNLKHEAVTMVRSWARDGMIHVVPSESSEEMKKQALRYRRHISGNTFKYGKQGEKDDFVCLLITHAVQLIRKNLETQSGTPWLAGMPTEKYRPGRYVASRR